MNEACRRSISARLKTSRWCPCGMSNSRVTFTRNSGFTLIEILVALAIIAIALAALIKASGNHTYSATYLKEKTLAHYVAMYEMEKLHLAKDRDWPDTGTEKKSTEMADHEWYWNREIKQMLDPITGKPSDQFIEVSFTVYADEDHHKNLTHLVSYLSRIIPAGQPLPTSPPQAPTQ